MEKIASARSALDQFGSKVIGLGTKVPILDGTHRRHIDFDNAATTPCLEVVYARVSEFLSWYSSIHRGAGFKSVISTAVYERARDMVADFVGADKETDVVIFVRNTTEALNKLARRFPFDEGDVVLTSIMEHHSNLLPWRSVAQVDYIALLPDGSLDIEDLRRKLRTYQGKVKLVSIAGASNVTGYVNPIHQIAELVHKAGAKIAVDAAQLAAHRPINMKPQSAPDHIDFVALSGHKMYAPFGTGALIGSRETFETGEPDGVGGGTVDFVTLDHIRWAKLPEKEEAGTPNVVGAVALATSALVLQRIGLETIVQHESELTGYLLEKMREIPGLEIFGHSDPALESEHLGIVSFSLEGVPHALVAAILSYEGGIGVRSGRFCAHPYVLCLLGVPPGKAEEYRRQIVDGDWSQLPGLVRVSLGLYNTKEEVDQLVQMLLRISQGQYEGDYLLDTGSGAYLPRGFSSQLESYFHLVPVGY